MTWLLAVSMFLAVTVLSIVPLAVLAVIYADNLLESLARTRRRIGRRARTGLDGQHGRSRTCGTATGARP